MKKNNLNNFTKKLNLFLTILTLFASFILGCGNDNFQKNTSEKNNETETLEISSVNDMAFIRFGAAFCQVVDADGNPVSYDECKGNKIVKISETKIDQNLSGTIHVKVFQDQSLGTKYLVSYTAYSRSVQVILDKNGLPKTE